MSLIATTPPAWANDWKAPPPIIPPPSLKEQAAPEYKQAASRALINAYVDQFKLPYVIVKGHDVKIAIRQEVLDAFKLQSGQEIEATLMWQVIDADRVFSAAAEELKNGKKR